MENAQQHFENNMTAITNQQQEVFDNTETAAAMLSLSLNEPCKILCLASPLCQPLLQLFSQQLNLALTMEQGNSSLAAININTSAAKIGYLYPAFGIDQRLFLQFRTMWHEGDSILLVSQNSYETENFASIIDYAHENSIPLVAIGHHKDEKLKELLGDEDISVLLTADNDFIFTELTLCILNSIINSLTAEL